MSDQFGPELMHQEDNTLNFEAIQNKAERFQLLTRFPDKVEEVYIHLLELSAVISIPPLLLPICLYNLFIWRYF